MRLLSRKRRAKPAKSKPKKPKRPLTPAQKKALAKRKALARRRALAKHKHKHPAKKHKKPAAKKKAPAKQPTPLPSKPTVPVVTPSPAAPPVTTPTSPEAVPSPVGRRIDGPSIPVYSGPFDTAQATRLLWRAGFGPKPGQAAALAAGSMQDAVLSLTRPSGAANLVGPEPHDPSGNPLSPLDIWGHDQLWWLDRMVRSDQQLVERMTLIWHDWFATSNDGVGSLALMIDQNQTLRSNALGNFIGLAQAVTADPAMLVWLNGIDNNKWSPNENYARELMELFTLGADRGAYSEADVRELAKVLTGWRADWDDDAGKLVNFRFDSTRHDVTAKTVFGQTGRWSWDGAVPLAVGNAYHRSFFVRKLWSYFIPSAPDEATQAGLEAVYVNGDYAIAPVVEAILQHPDLYDGAPMVKNPAVFLAGLLRSLGLYITTDAWSWRLEGTGMVLFNPPNVSGWNDQAWLDTSTLQARWNLAYEALNALYVNPSSGTYSTTETPAQALAAAEAFMGSQPLSTETRAALLTFATSAIPGTAASWEQGSLRAQRQNALRHLIATSPDVQTC